MVKMLDGDEHRYIVMRDRELLVSQMVFDIDYCIKFYTHFEQDGKEFYVYELCSGGDLTELKNQQPDNRFSEVTAKKFVEQISHSINEMHKRRIVHRDIKPDNIFISDPVEQNCRTGDYGTARLVNENFDFVPEANETINSTVAGSGFYMSPEMKLEKPNGTKTDVFSFGVTIGVLLGLDSICPDQYKTGVPGFIKNCAANKHDLLLHRNNIHLSPILKDLLKNMLLVDPAKRFSMQQVLDHRYVADKKDKYIAGFTEWENKEI